MPISQSSFKKLDTFSKAGIGDEDVPNLIQFLKSKSNIEKIDLSWNRITDLGLKLLIDAFPNLKELDMRGNQITARGAELLANTGLENLNISFNSIGMGVRSFVRSPKLIELSASNCDVGSTDVKILLENEILEKIDLSGNKIEDDGLSGLYYNNVVTEINFADNNLTKKCAKYIAENSSLLKVDLSGNTLGNQGAKNLANSRSILDLTVAGCGITVAGAEFFFKKNTLETLDLADNDLLNSTNNRNTWHSYG